MMEEKQPEHEFERVYSSPKQGEIGLIKSLLDGENIPYYIKGENFGTLYGPADGLSSMEVMIRKDYLETAKELLQDFIK